MSGGSKCGQCCKTQPRSNSTITLSFLWESRVKSWTRMDGRMFARFHVDVGIGDEVMEPVEVVEGRDWLGFGGIAPPSFPIISREQQFAEKVHAYTLPRGDRVNTRAKELIDMVLLIWHEKLDNPRLAAAIKATFAKRATHPMPPKLDPPPSEWEPVFQALARECDLDVRLSAGFETVQGFVGKILGRQTGQTN